MGLYQEAALRSQAKKLELTFGLKKGVALETARFAFNMKNAAPGTFSASDYDAFTKENFGSSITEIQNDYKAGNTASLNSLYQYGGSGAGVGVFAGITLTFFERGKIEQFALGKFLLKYSWYGAIGGGILGAGVGLIPYSSSNDYGDIVRYGGYGAGAGLVASLVLFFIDLPDHLKLYTYQREGQNVFLLTLRF